MDLFYFSLFGLVVLFVFAQICGYGFKIRSDKFFMPFHFLGGLFTALLCFTLWQNLYLSVFFTILVGIAWEVYEWLSWRFVLKKDIYKPKRRDTMYDLLLDTAGALTVVGVLFFLMLI